MNKYGKPDANHAEIVRILRRCGCMVADTKMVGSGFPDIVAWNPRNNILVMLEIKDGNKPPSKQKLTKAEEQFHADWDGAPVFVVNSSEEAMQVLGLAVDDPPPF